MVSVPLAVEKAKAGYKVIGFDNQQKKVDLVNQGDNYIGDVVDEELDEPALKIIDKLAREGAEIVYNDPWIPELDFQGKRYSSEPLSGYLLQEVDVVLITTDHSQYDYQRIVEKANLIFDTRNATKGINSKKSRSIIEE